MLHCFSLRAVGLTDLKIRGSCRAWRKVRAASGRLPPVIRIADGDRRCGATKCRPIILQLTRREIESWLLGQHRPLQAGQCFVEVHRKPPLDNQGPEKTRRKPPNRPKLVSICAAYGGAFMRESACELGLICDAYAPGEKVIGLAGGAGSRARTILRRIP